MIQYIALAAALNANKVASDGLETSQKALRSNGDPFIVIKPVNTEFVADKEQKGFLRSIFPSGKEVLNKEPFGSFSIRRSDIIRLTQSKDDEGTPFVLVELSDTAAVEVDEEYLEMVNIPGTLEEITAVLNG